MITSNKLTSNLMKPWGLTVTETQKGECNNCD